MVTAGISFGKGVSDRSGHATLAAFRPSEKLPAHQHVSAHISLLLSGDVVQETRGEECRIALGEAGYHPAGEQHQNRIGANGAVCLSLWICETHAPASFRVRKVPPLLRLEANRLASDLTLGRAERLAIESLAADLTAPGCAGDFHQPLPVSRVLEAIESRRDWSLGELARIADRHPGHLARAFRKATGFTIGGYRRRLRLMDLLLDLRTDSAPLGELAARHGYSDQAHMTRDVKRFAGAPPGALRSLCAPAAT